MKKVATFLIILSITGVYTYYVGAQTSMLIVYMLLLCIPVSLLLTWPMRKCLDIHLEFTSTEVEKDGVIKINLIIKNTSFLPVPFVHIDFLEAKNLSFSEPMYQHISISPYEIKMITVKYHANFRGTGEIGLRRMVLKDYLGFFSFSLLKHLENRQYIGKVTVLPRISNMKLSQKIMQTSGKVNLSNEAEAHPAGISSWSGEPGHEYREYQAGDPLHRVHWKLSAKSEQLMVRKNEGGGLSKKCLIIDPFLMNTKSSGKQIPLLKREEDTIQCAIEDKLLEAVLSVANMVIKGGRLVEVWLNNDDHWLLKTVSYKKELLELQHLLAGYHFSNIPFTGSNDRLPLNAMAKKEKMNRSYKGGDAILFTGCYDDLLQQSLETVSQYNLSLDLVWIKNEPDLDDSKGKFKALEQGLLWVLKTTDVLSEAIV